MNRCPVFRGYWLGYLIGWEDREAGRAFAELTGERGSFRLGYGHGFEDAGKEATDAADTIATADVDWPF